MLNPANPQPQAPDYEAPDYVANLQAIYGPPSQAGFGSAVFYEPLNNASALEQTALKYYRYFVGDLWERWGEAAWMMPWKQVYRRQPGDAHQIIAEMQAIAPSDAAQSLSLVLTSGDDFEATHRALSAAYDDATVTELVIYTLGDGAAMSGVLVAGYRETGDATFLTLLLD
ncbi:hypothetical protein [Leptolyngbya sp. O-77]|uniref:hypothetical protein n=1 Tax=Leptolyngbya sp. O-77 TaxID=1080068 RepID=UPI00074D3110|nr:hypothetical protein [Leptolyngbya sp. O-77]BAU41490.1 hypothetical protein O77CONTIG1_01300 [Leptolyngbya sp. O-77]